MRKTKAKLLTVSRETPTSPVRLIAVSPDGEHIEIQLMDDQKNFVFSKFSEYIVEDLRVQ